MSPLSKPQKACLVSLARRAFNLAGARAREIQSWMFDVFRLASSCPFHLDSPLRFPDYQPMRSRSRLLFLVLSIAALCIIAWFLLPPAGPSYNGRSLNYWLFQLHANLPSRQPRAANTYPGTAQFDEAIEAIRAIGTNALPQLLAGLEMHDSPFKIRLITASQRQSIIKLPLMDETDRHSVILVAFRILGTRAKPAVPALAQILDRADPDLIDSVAPLFFFFGADGIPPLTNALNHTNWSVRAAAASALAAYARTTTPGRPAFDAEHIDVFAAQIIPVLLAHVSDTNDIVRERIVTALGAFHRQPDLVVPVLTNALSDSYAPVQHYAARGLGTFGSNALVAVPQLLVALKENKEPVFTGDIVGAIKNIDPPAVSLSVLPTLTSSLASSNAAVRSAAIYGIRTLGSAAAPMVPALAVHLTDPDPRVRADTVLALQTLGAVAAPAVPALIDALQDSNPQVRTAVAYGLQYLGPAAKSAVPALLQTLNDPAPGVRLTASNTLKVLDPAALANSRAKPTNSPAK